MENEFTRETMNHLALLDGYTQRDILFDVLAKHYIGNEDRLWVDINAVMNNMFEPNAFPDINFHEE